MPRQPRGTPRRPAGRFAHLQKKQARDRVAARLQKQKKQPRKG